MANRRSTRFFGRGPDGEAGLVAVWVAMGMIVILGFAAWAVDFSRWNDERTHMQKAADAAALAGAVYLPDDPTGAIAAARSIAAKNGYSSGVAVNVLSSANQLKVTINKTVDNAFGPVIGVGNTSMSKHAVGEYESPQPLDMVLIIDRTGSMRSPLSAGKTPLQNVQDATLAVLGYLNPKNESIALGVLGPSSATAACGGASAGAYGVYSGSDVTAPGATWMAAPYPLAAPSNDYQLANGSLNSNSQIVKTVNCLQYGNLTDLGDPVLAATTYLNTYGRPGARRGIILMTDGAANLPNGTQPCGYANSAATTAKAAGIQVLTIGFLSGSNTCERDTSGTFRAAQVTRVLASMASPIKGVPAVDNGCNTVENTDGDNFFCQPKGGDIEAVFLAAVGQLAGRLPRIVE
jgi:Flp pilus assembly protein TadG